MPDRVIVVGAGVIGTGIAYELVRRRLPVILLDSLAEGGATSAASAGMVNPLGMSTEQESLIPLGLISYRVYEEWAQTLLEEVGIDIEWSRCGALKLALNETEASQLGETARWMQKYDPEVTSLSAQEAQKMEPLIPPTVHGALWLPNEGHVDGQRLVRALRTAAIQAGAEFYGGEPVVGFEVSAQRVIGVQTARGTLQGATVVLAAGAWTGALLQTLGVKLAIQPVRGQILVLSDPPKPLRHVVYSILNYVVPQRDGTILLGATTEEVGFASSPTAEGFTYLLNTLPPTLPALAKASFAGYRVGLRPSSPDGEPIIGSLPPWDNLLIASGHYRHGILLAPATAKAIADLITLGKTDLPIASFSPARLIKE